MPENVAEQVAELLKEAEQRFGAGQRKEGIEIAERARDLARAGGGDNDLPRAESLNCLGDLYCRVSRYADAEPALKEALEIRQSHLPVNLLGVAESLDSLGTLYHSIGSHDLALEYYRPALEIREKNPRDDDPKVATSLNNLAVVYRELGRSLDAEPLHLRALEIAQKEPDKNLRLVATSLNDLGDLYATMGDYAKAEQRFREALEIRQKLPDKRMDEVAESCQDLAVLYGKMGDYARSEQLFMQVGESVEVDLPTRVLILGNLVKLRLTTGRVEAALDALKKLYPLFDQLMIQAFAIGSEERRARFLLDHRKTYPLLMTVASRFLSHSPEAVRLAVDVTLRHKALQTAALSHQRDALLESRYVDLAPELRVLMSLRAKIADEILAGPGDEGLEAHRQTLEMWGAQKRAMEEALVRQIPEMTLDDLLGKATRSEVAGALPEGSALVEFVCFKDQLEHAKSRYAAMVLHARAPDRVTLLGLGDADEIDDLVAGFRSAITGRRETPDGRDLEWTDAEEPSPGPRAGESLREIVFDPLVPALGACRRLFIAPDAELFRVPFEVLPIADGKYLVDDYTISYLTSGRDVLRFSAHSAVSTAVPVVIADPDFDLAADGRAALDAPAAGVEPRDLDRGGMRFDRLPGLAEEGRQIAARLGVIPWLGGGALEGRVKALRSPSILHIATHGFFLGNQVIPSNVLPESALGRLLAAGKENPLLRSGLALAGANTWLRGGALHDEAEDGLLHGDDVAVMDLCGTDLVVLSACETGLGEIRRGDGVHGLRRAFTVAGARTLVMSLWKVPDRETQALMLAFYEGLLAGKGKSEALREAQRRLRRDRPEPYFWGAFICQGDPER